MTLAIPTDATTPKPQRLGRQRARTLEDKDLRRSHLLQAAAELFAQTDFDGVTIANMAQRAGVAKGTAYLYFSCKEAVFLELVQAELILWEADLNQALQTQLPQRSPDAVPTAIARTLARRPMLGRLLVLLHSVIEPRLDLESAHAFKIFLRDLVGRLSCSLVQNIPGLDARQAATLVMQIHALVISVTQLASPPPVIAQVLAQDSSLQLMCIGFESFLADTLGTLLRGTLPPSSAHS
jgi:AcrR family transcriptional regulator